jgi:acetylornithine aminotransferase
MKEQGLAERAGNLGARIQQGFSEQLDQQPIVREIRGRGLMLAIELTAPCGELVQAALAQGLLINVAAGNSIRLLPPLIMSDSEADELVERVSALIIEFGASTDAGN